MVVPFSSDISFESPYSISNEIEKGLSKDNETTSHLSTVSASSSELYKEHTNRNYSTFYIGKIMKQPSHIDQFKGFKASRDKEHFTSPHVFATTATEDLDVKPCKNVNIYIFSP